MENEKGIKKIKPKHYSKKFCSVLCRSSYSWNWYFFSSYFSSLLYCLFFHISLTGKREQEHHIGRENSSKREGRYTNLKPFFFMTTNFTNSSSEVSSYKFCFMFSRLQWRKRKFPEHKVALER